MKRKYPLALAAMLCMFTVFAEKGINYQAVARNAAGQPLINTTVALRFSVHTDSARGAVVFREKHVVPTSAFGMINVVVGGGMSILGNMDTVDWSGDKYLQVEYDAAGGNNFLDMGTTQMLGAMFSSYANRAGTALRADRALLAEKTDTAITATMAINAAHSLTADVAATATTALTTSGITVPYAESMAESTTTSLTPLDKVSLTLQPGTYLLTFSAMVSCNHAHDGQYSFDAGTTVFSGITQDNPVGDYTSISNTLRVSYTTPTTVRITYNKTGGSGTLYIKNATISALATN